MKNENIIVRLQGGLGNQIWQYCAALAWRSQYVGSAKMPSILLDLSNVKPRQFLLGNLLIDSGEIINTANYDLTDYTIYREKEEFNFAAEILTLAPNVILEGFFQHYRYFELAKPNLQLRSRQVPLKYQKLRQKYQLVALHVRRGDYTDEAHLGLYNCVSIGYYRSALASIRAKVAKPYILIFSDDLNWVRENIQPLVSNLQMGYSYPAGGSLEDFYSMLQCSHFVIANSSYSACAALLGQRENTLIFSPQMWHLALNIEAKQLLPADWQTVVSTPASRKNISAPKVSIIIPVYNTREYLLRCLESVRNQTIENIEIIIVDDASPDNSWQLIKNCAAQDKRIVAIRHEQNKHLGGARNTGIKIARGEWLLFVDSDDYIRLDMVEIFLAGVAKYPEIELFICQAMEVKNGRLSPYGAGASLAAPTIIADPFVAYCRRLEILPAAWGKLWRRQLFIANEIYFPENTTMEDFPTTLRLFHTVNKVMQLPEKLYYYQQRRDSIMRSYADQSTQDYGKAIGFLWQWGQRKLSRADFALLIEFCLIIFRNSMRDYITLGLPEHSGSAKEKGQEILRRYNLFFTEGNEELAYYFLKSLEGQDLEVERLTKELATNPWYRLGQLSNWGKIWAIIKFISKRLRNLLLRPLKIIAHKIKN